MVEGVTEETEGEDDVQFFILVRFFDVVHSLVFGNGPCHYA